MKYTSIMMAALLAVSAGSASAASYDLDASHSTIGFGVKHMVVTTTKGQFTEYAGGFEYDSANPASLKAQATIKVASVDTGNAKRDDHLRNADFFDVATHPDITFVSTGAVAEGDQVVLTGNLTIKGVTKEIKLPLTVNGPITDPWGNVRVGLEGKAKINRQDFGVTWSKTMDGGGLVVGDDVTLDIVVEGIQKKAE
jgi:polyisoprenoid-binding protein YceI